MRRPLGWGIALSLSLVTACGLDVLGSATGAPDGGLDSEEADSSPEVDGDPTSQLEGGTSDSGCGVACATDGGGVTLTVNVSGTTAAGAITSSAGGLTCPGSCSGTFPAGTTITLTAASPTSDVLVSWSGGGCTGREPACTFTLSAATTVTATFAPLVHFAHSPTRLYKVDGATGVASGIADFGGACAGVTMGDLAVDRAGAMLAISIPAGGGSSSLYAVDPTTAVCATATGSLGQRCNALTFAPDPANPAQDALFAACTTSVYRVSRTTGAATLLGALGGGWQSSGDIVYVPGVGLLATLYNGGTDRLGKIDPLTGAATVIGNTNQSSLYALGYRGAKVLAYGNGTAFTLDVATGAATSLNAATTVNAYGAASGP
jgi:hypothetical protein